MPVEINVSVNHQHLRAFHAVASEGSFSRAARRLNISQPTLSQQIKALENRHGSYLFEGRNRPLRLTLVGRELFGLTARMFATSQDIDDLLGTPRDTAGEQIRIAADTPLYAARLAQALSQGDDAIEVDVRMGNSSQTLQRLHDAHVDVAIICDPQIDPRFVYQPLFMDCLKVVLPVSHPLANVQVFPMARLAGETMLLREATSKTSMAMTSLMRAHDIAPARRIVLDSREVIREAVALGMGVSLFFSADCPPDPRLAAVMPECQPDAGQLTGYLAFRADQRRLPLIRRAVACAEALKVLSPIALPSRDL